MKKRPQNLVGPGDLELVATPVAELKEGEILARNLYLSLDPTNRLWMSDREQYRSPVGIGDVMRGSTIAVVEESRSAHFGFLDLCAPRQGETVVVSATAGAVGSIVGQIAKIKGCRVIGIAGGYDKCRWIVDSLGFDGAIDYRSEAIGRALDRLCPKGIDMNFENVGGPIMDAVFSRLNVKGRMALCGMISLYNEDGPLPGPTDFGRVLMNRLTIRGFIVIDFLTGTREAHRQLKSWIADGRLTWKDHIIDGLELAPNALKRLFTGDHDGKLVVRLSPDV